MTNTLLYMVMHSKIIFQNIPSGKKEMDKNTFGVEGKFRYAGGFSGVCLYF